MGRIVVFGTSLLIRNVAFIFPIIYTLRPATLEYFYWAEYCKNSVFLQNLIPKIINVLRKRDYLDLMITFDFLTTVSLIN